MRNKKKLKTNHAYSRKSSEESQFISLIQLEHLCSAQPNNVIGLSITKNKHNMKQNFWEMLNVSEI